MILVLLQVSGYTKDGVMSLYRKRTEKALMLVLIGAGLSAGIWLMGHWRERERAWRWAREANQELARQQLRRPQQEPETHYHNGHQPQ